MTRDEDNSWVVCQKCHGLGKKRKRLRKKKNLFFQPKIIQFDKTKNAEASPIHQKHQISCSNCSGFGLVSSINHPIPDIENYPHVAIIGGGIGGVALAVACFHRRIPFTLYERDNSFDDRSQGYGLTLQQASKAMKGFGIFDLEKGVISTKHIVHNTDGKIIGEWGKRKWEQSSTKKAPKRINIHIARQSLRLALLKQLISLDTVKWGHKLVDFQENKNDTVDLNFQVNGQMKQTKANLVVGADGIRSSVRELLIGEQITPLRYLDCIVILGICPLADLTDIESSLLDSATVFQTANGNERIYMMPYSSDAIMWQLSFPLSENEAKSLSAQGAKSLKYEACRRTQWHDPIPQILAATNENKISGYPVYDRELLTPDLLKKGKQITLIGDAAHPMSPFKGQGANQALLDALSLARNITKGCNSKSQWRKSGIRESVLTEFEAEMLKRSASKVKSSAEAAKFLHSDIVLHEGNETRGKCVKRK